MSDEKLAKVVRELLDGGQLAELPEETVARLEALCPRPPVAGDSTRQPLWFHVRDAFWVHYPCLDLEIFDLYLDWDDYAALFRLCGVEEVVTPSDLGVLATAVSRDELRRGLELGMGHEETDVKEHAMILAGLAGMDDLQPMMWECARQDPGVLGYSDGKVWQAAVAGLLLMDAPGAEELVPTVFAEDEGLDGALVAYLERHPELVSADQYESLKRNCRKGFLHVAPRVTAQVGPIPYDDWWGLTQDDKPCRTTVTLAAALAHTDMSGATVGVGIEHAAMAGLIALRGGDAEARRKASAVLALEAESQVAPILIDLLAGRAPSEPSTHVIDEFAEAAWQCGVFYEDEPKQAIGARRRDHGPFPSYADAIAALLDDPESRRAAWLADGLASWSTPWPHLVLDAVCRDRGIEPPSFVKEVGLLFHGRRDELLEFYRSHPWRWARMLRWQSSMGLGIDAALSIATLAVDLGRSIPSALLTELAFKIEDKDPLVVLCAEALVAGTPPSLMRTLIRVLASPAKEPFRPRADEVPYLGLLASHQLSEISEVVLGVLARGGEDSVGLLDAILLTHGHRDVGNVAEIARFAATSNHPVVRDTIAIANDASSLDDIQAPALQAANNDWKVRERFAAFLGRCDGDIEARAGLLGCMLIDPWNEVRTEVMHSLARILPTDQSLREYVVADLRTLDRHRCATAAVAAGLIGDPTLLPVLTASLAMEVNSFSSLMSNDPHQAVLNAIRAIAEKHPELGVVVFSIASMADINRIYGLDESVPFREQDRDANLAALIAGLEKSADAAFAEECRGRKVLVSSLPDEGVPGPVPGCLSVEEWGKLALYLEPVFADEQGGDVVAEVGGEPVGTLLTGLFDGGDWAVVRGGWS